jgi:hypothetical protein
VSGLVLNFVPDANAAMLSIRERLRRAGMAAAYVWDYAHGMEFLRWFWDEAVALDPRAEALDEGKRFPLCEPPALEALFERAGFRRIASHALEIPTDFDTLDDCWAPLLGGTGPAPSYVASLRPHEREVLRMRLARRLRTRSDGRIRLRARAWAVRGFSP